MSWPAAIVICCALLCLSGLAGWWAWLAHRTAALNNESSTAQPEED